MLKHKETHAFTKKDTAYRLTATVEGRQGVYYIALKVIDLEPIVSEYEHVHTKEQVRNTYFETWTLQTDAFYNLDEARNWTALNLDKIINDFDSGKNPRWEQEF